MAKKLIKVTVKPTIEELRKRNAAAQKGMAKLDIPHKKISIFLDRWVQSNFKSEGGKVGGWKPLALSTVLGRKQGGGGGGAKILQDTGRLRISYVPFASKKTAGIGSDLPYSKTHEEGIDVQKRRMLPRTVEVEADVHKIYDQHVGKQLNKMVGK